MSLLCISMGYYFELPTFYNLQVDYVVASSVPDMAESLEELGGKVISKDPSAGPLESNMHLAVGCNIVKNTVILSNLAASVKDGGFVLCVEDTASMGIDGSAVGLMQICKWLADDKAVLLFRKVRLVLGTYFVLHTIELFISYIMVCVL